MLPNVNGQSGSAPMIGRFASHMLTRRGIAHSIMVAGTIGVVACFWYNASTLSVILTLVVIASLALADLRAALVLTFPATALAGALISLGVIEEGAYISEQARNGFNIGATPLFGLYTIAFLSVAYVALSLMLNRPASSPPIRPYPLLFLITAISLGSGVFYGIVFSIFGFGVSHSARFDWMQTLPDIVVKLHLFFGSFAIPLAFAISGLFCRVFGLRARWPWMSLLLIPVLSLIGTGEKFSGFYMIICMTLTGVGLGWYLLRTDVNFRFRWRHIGVITSISLVMGVTVIAGYLRMGTSVNGLWEAIGTRLALQGHVWFGIYDRFSGEPGVPVTSLLRVNVHDAPGGLDFLSYLVADHNYVYQRIGRGISFTMGGPPSALAAFGTWPGLLIYGLLGIFYALAAYAALLSIRYRLEMLAALSIVFYLIVGAATQMGRWDTAYGTVAITTYALGALGTGFAIIGRRARSRAKVATKPASDLTPEDENYRA